MRRVKYWEIIADNLHDVGWSLGWVSALDLEGRTIRIVDAHGYGKRFVNDALKRLIVRGVVALPSVIVPSHQVSVVVAATLGQSFQKPVAAHT